jgi:hypothetical protein
LDFGVHAKMDIFKTKMCSKIFLLTLINIWIGGSRKKGLSIKEEKKSKVAEDLTRTLW